MFVSHIPGASLADHAVSVELMPLNTAKDFFLFFFMMNFGSDQLSYFPAG